MVKEHGFARWGLIAKKIVSHFNFFPRTGKQCRERWHNHLDPSIKKDSWSDFEKRKIFDLHKLYGNSWSQIAANLEGRTDNAVKNFFYSHLRKKIRKSTRKNYTSKKDDEETVGNGLKREKKKVWLVDDNEEKVATDILYSLSRSVKASKKTEGEGEKEYIKNEEESKEECRAMVGYDNEPKRLVEYTYENACALYSYYYRNTVNQYQLNPISTAALISDA